MARLPSCSDVPKARPGEKHGRKEDRDIDTCIERVLRELRDVAELARIVAARTRTRDDCRNLREYDRRRKKHEEKRKPDRKR